MNNVKKLLEIAQTFNKNKAWQKTIDALSEKELKVLESADLYAEKAEAFYRLKKHEDSKVEAENALTLEPSNVKGNYFLSAWFAFKLNYDKSVEYCQKAIQIAPGFAYPYYGLGNVYHGKKEYDKAIEYYHKAIELDPTFASPYNGLGTVYRDKKEDDKAVEYYQKAIKLDPTDAYPYYSLGNIYYKKRIYDKAIENYQKAIELDQTFASPYNDLGNVYRDKKEYDKAVEQYQKAIELDPGYAYPYNGLGNVYRDKKEYNKAFEYYQIVIQLAPTDAYPHYSLGNVYRDKKEIDKAVEHYQKAIQLDPGYAYPHNGLGNLYREQNEYDKAVEHYQKAIQLAPTDAYPYYGLGNMYYDKKIYDKAIEYYQKAIFFDPGFVYPHIGLGYVYYEIKEYYKAVEHNRMAIQLDPYDAAPYYGLGITYSAIKEYNKAIKAFEKYIEITPDKTNYFFSQAKEHISEFEKLIGYSDNYGKISKSINDIKLLLLVEGGCITHYTSLSATRFMILNGSKFRLSEGAFLNDTSEGRELFQYLNFHVARANNHETSAELFSRKPFIGSFVNEHKHDDLTLWRMYGKENKEEARGCAITLNMNQLVDKLKEELSSKSAVTGSKRDVIALMDKEFVFYQVAYRNQEKNEFMLPGADSEKNKLLNNLMRKLAKSVTDFNAHKKKNLEEQRDAVVLLNEIAYLFKTAEYQYENEIRLVIEKTGFDVKFIESEEVPKAYIEIGNIRKAITKITLGPKIERASEWAAVFYYSLQKDDLKPDIFISRLPFK